MYESGRRSRGQCREEDMSVRLDKDTVGFCLVEIMRRRRRLYTGLQPEAKERRAQPHMGPREDRSFTRGIVADKVGHGGVVFGRIW